MHSSHQTLAPDWFSCEQGFGGGPRTSSPGFEDLSSPVQDEPPNPLTPPPSLQRRYLSIEENRKYEERKTLNCLLLFWWNVSVETITYPALQVSNNAQRCDPELVPPLDQSDVLGGGGGYWAAQDDPLLIHVSEQVLQVTGKICSRWLKI